MRDYMWKLGDADSMFHATMAIAERLERVAELLESLVDVTLPSPLPPSGIEVDEGEEGA